MGEWERKVACSFPLTRRQSWGQRDFKGDEGGAGRARAQLVVPTGQHGRRVWTEAWQSTGAVGGISKNPGG